VRTHGQVAFGEGLAEAAGQAAFAYKAADGLAGTKCLTRQAALHVLRSAANPCVAYTQTGGRESGGRESGGRESGGRESGGRESGGTSGATAAKAVYGRASAGGGMGVYAALGLHGYFDRAILALDRHCLDSETCQYHLHHDTVDENVGAGLEGVGQGVSSQSKAHTQWQAWLAQYNGTWSDFWTSAEAYLAARIPLLSDTWLHDQLPVTVEAVSS